MFLLDRYERSFLTNFSIKDEMQYQMSLEEYGKDDIWIEDTAFDCNGCLMEEDKSLHHSPTANTNKFWRIWGKIAKQLTLKGQED